ncbi:DUF3187 family protein [Gallaecimonas kandeliae]|uniref:DUF3187 family protein n=1 Tax=Gallaecimonas kandeliae TaxID=3029055 RepID=UPI0026492FDC|nr:DUF3187 family protein [Gallaecimonas kandeliae]WKE67208.1 DUF3187 family protein [Gallaecimonas kandeliae]
MPRTLLLLALMAVLPRGAAEDFGPLQLMTQAPLFSSSLMPGLRDAALSASGPVEADLDANTASIWDQDDQVPYSLDYYQSDLTARLSGQVAPGWRLEGAFSYHWVANSHLDNLTEHFHKAFGISENGREKVPKNDSRIWLPSQGADYRDFNGATLDRTLTLYGELNLFADARQAMSLGASLFWNQLGGRFAKHQFEQALQLNYSLNIASRHQLHLLLAASHRQEEGFADIRLRRYSWNAATGYRYQLSSHQALLAEYRLYQGLAPDLGQFKKPLHELALGYRYQWQSSALEFAVIENAVSYDNCADIAFALNGRWRF